MGFGRTTAASLIFLSVPIFSMSIDMLDTSSMEPVEPNYCNNSDLLPEAGLYRSTLGQFLGFDCSQEFFHCRWQSDGFRTYRKLCKTGLVYDVHGTQNCNYDYNVKSCGITGNGPAQCNSTDFLCPLSGQCVHMSQRCDGRYDCVLEEDEQNCPLCAAGEFACIVSEQCIPLDRRCNGLSECADGTDEKDCDVCGHGFFHCSKSNECVPIDQRCDGRRQCPHGEDEMLCKKPAGETKFTCQSRDENIPMLQVCDGIPQCKDGSDEIYCDMGGGGSGSSSLSFSSNPNPPVNPAPQPLPPAPQPQPKEEEEEEYEYEEEPEKQQPSFPMLALVTPPPPPVIRTTAVPQTPRTYPPTPPATVAPTTGRPVFSRPKPKISPPQQMKQAVSITPRIVQSFEITAPTSPATTGKPSTMRHPPPTQGKPESQGKRIRYPTKSVSEVVETVRITMPTVRPRNQNVQQLYDRTLPTTKAMPSTQQHALIVEVTSPPIPVHRIKENVMKQLSSQISNGMTPELMAKIERLLTDELRGTKRRRPVSPREASISPIALFRTLNSKVQILQ